jgi:hypothetical protein
MVRNNGTNTDQGTVVGTPTSNGLKRAFGSDKVATEGIPYAALIGTNALPGGTDTQSKNLLKNTLNSMAQRCPDSVIVARVPLSITALSKSSIAASKTRLLV